jgi:ABC-2 type transport system permease protein
MMDMLSEIIAIFNRWNKKLLRQPILIFFNLIQPLVWFLLFTQAFSAIGNIPSFKLLTGTSSYITFFTAAVIIQTITSSALGAGLGIVTDFDSGFMDKMRVAPINKSSILFGRLFSAALTTILQVIIILISSMDLSGRKLSMRLSLLSLLG